MTIVVDLTENSLEELEACLDVFDWMVDERQQREREASCWSCTHWVPAGALICWYCHGPLQLGGS
jgi:hypothetical protein